jgi:hypothetical protein
VLLSPLLLSTAHAAPTFTGTPEDVALAARVWDAARTCTSREGIAHATVAIRRDLVGDDGAIGGAASWDAKGLHTIELTKDAPSVLLAHEVGHAWFTGTGPLGPIEGRTELLAECVARSHRDVIPYLYDPYDLLDDMPELTTWTAATQKTMTPQQVQAVYAGSLRFFLAMGEIVSPSDLFAAGAMDWARVRALLGNDPRGAPLVAVLDGGAKTERAALADPDQDGVTTVGETMHGTDPNRWDTDGDGWWDGRPASLPPGALPVPHDSSRICPHKLAGEGETRLIVGGNLRGFDLGGYALTLSGNNNYLQFAPELAERPGGYWYMVIGKSLTDNPGCRVTPLVTLRAVDGATPEELDALVHSLAAAHAKVATLVPLTERLVVDVAGNGVQGGRGGATVASDVVGWAMKKPDLRMPVLATTIVAKIVIPQGDRLRIEQEAFVQAMVRTLCGAEERVPGPTVTEAQIRAAQKQVDAAGGWASFVGK